MGRHETPPDTVTRRAGVFRTPSLPHLRLGLSWQVGSKKIHRQANRALPKRADENL